MVEYLIQKGATVDAYDNEKSTPLHVAAQNGRLEVVKLLLVSGAELHHQDDNGMSALHWAAYNGRDEVVRLLVQSGADVNVKKAGENSSGSVPLHGAAFYGHPQVVAELVNLGAELELTNDFGYTPLLSGVAGGQTECAYILLDAGANPNVMLPNGISLLHSACWRPNLELIKKLVESGAEVNAKDDNGNTPLAFASGSGNAEVVAYLLKNGADAATKTNNGYTALHRATHVDSTEVITLLIKHGADVNAKTDEGIAAIHNAVSRGNRAVVEAMLKGGTNPNLKDEIFQQTCLHKASIKGNNEIVESLLDSGAEISAKDKLGNTPLYYAGKYGHKKTAKLLNMNGGKADDFVGNFGNNKLLEKKLHKGEAVVWYLGHNGFAVSTKDKFLIFDYWKNSTEPANPCLANGHIDPEEIKDKEVYVFVSHEHQDHFDQRILTWEEVIPKIKYIFGFKPEEQREFREEGYNGPEYVYAGPRENLAVDDIAIHTIKANDAGVGFLLDVDGLQVYFAGDHAGWREGERQGYIDEIDYIANYVKDLDMALLNVTGCHAQGEEPLREGNYYTLNLLQPNLFIPTHGLDREYVYEEFVKRMQDDGKDFPAFVPFNPGDNYIYKSDTFAREEADD